MNKKDFYWGLYEHIKKTIGELNDFETEINSAREKLNSRSYAEEHKAKVITPMLSELKGKKHTHKEEALKHCKKLCSEFISSLEGRTYDPSELTDDAKLLGLGVRISDADLERIFDRNAGNYTMEKLIFAYAEQNGANLKRQPQNPNAIDISNANALPQICEYTFKNHDNPEFFEQFWGEGSSTRAAFLE